MYKACSTKSVCGLLALLWSADAAAQSGEADRDCSAMLDTAREAEEAGRLRAALELYRNCGLDGCGDPERTSCQARLMRLELEVTSLVPRVKDPAGEQRVDAPVSLVSRPPAVDAGLHERTLSPDGAPQGGARVPVAQGQRDREVWLVLPAPSEPAPLARAEPRPSAPDLQLTAAAELPDPVLSAPAAATSASAAHGRSLTPYLLGGTALLGAGAYALLSSWARDDNAQLARCTPHCRKDSVLHIRNLYIAADISLGVGAAAALGSIASFVFWGPSAQPESAPRRRYALSIQPGRSGALAVLRGAL